MGYDEPLSFSGGELHTPFVQPSVLVLWPLPRRRHSPDAVLGVVLVHPRLIRVVNFVPLLPVPEQKK